MNFKTAKPNPTFPEINDLAPQEVSENKSQLCLIDVRESDEYTGELGHIDTALLVNLDALPQYMDKLAKDRPVIFVCRSGARSARAAAYARQNGHSNVFNMQGGMLLWNQLGFTIAK